MTPSVALVVTARDEARLLPANLDYHRHIGVERAFVYLDDPTDGTGESLRGLDWVDARPTVEPERFRRAPGLERFVDAWSTIQTARQCLDVADAMERAEAEGFQWLLSIDADELVCLDRRRAASGALPHALADVPADVARVHLPNLEVVQTARVPGLVFRDARLFKVPGGPAVEIRDPRTGEPVARTWFFGHSAGKEIVRLHRGARPRSVHEFCGSGGEPLPAVQRGEILHYYSYDIEDWRRRHRVLQVGARHYLSGDPVEPQRLLWCDLVQSQHPGLDEYFEATLVSSAARLAALKRGGWWTLRPRHVVEVAAVAQAFRTVPRLQRH